MRQPTALPKFSTGLNPLLASFRQGPLRRRTRIMEQPSSLWDSSFVASDASPEALRMAEFGYRDDELPSLDGVVDDLAMVTPVRVLNREGTAALAEVCRNFEPLALGSSFIISRRLRGADLLSPFLYNMLRDRSFLLRMSRLAGVPLIPHPVRRAAAQINYYNAEPDKSDDLGKWHLDGMDYVLSMLLTDPAEFEGGEFAYFVGRSDEFDRRAIGDADVRTAPLNAAGDASFFRGSHIYHGVSPVTSGKRMVLTLSFFCPSFAALDSNTFLHVAADDGVPKTVPGWLRLKWPTRNPFRDYALRSSSPVVTWQDLKEDDASAIPGSTA
jgi:hypothetical protein